MVGDTSHPADRRFQLPSKDVLDCASLVPGGMPKPERVSRVIRFGLFEADLAAGELRKNGLKIKLQDRPFEILSFLLERPGELISREEFRQRLWPADTFVDFDHSLNASINKLRQALDDPADNPRFVATVGRRGYKFIAPVGELGRQGGPTVAAAAEVEPSIAATPFSPASSTLTKSEDTAAETPRRIQPLSRSLPRKWLGIAAAMIVCALAGTLVVLETRPKPVLTETDSILISD